MRILDLIDGFSSASAPAVGTVGSFTTAATQSVGAAGTITISLTGPLQFIRVQGNAGAFTSSTTPNGSTAPANGAVFIYKGMSASNTLTIPHNDAAKGFILNGDAVLGLNCILAVIYLSTEDRYEELFRLIY